MHENTRSTSRADSGAPLRAELRSQVIWMLIAAVLFGYFGFVWSWSHRYTLPPDVRLLPMVTLLMYTLRISAITFIVAAILAYLGRLAGLRIYALVGLLGGIAFLAVAIWDFAAPNYFSGIHPGILIIFAAWNGYSSWRMLLEVRDLRHRARRPGQDRPPIE